MKTPTIIFLLTLISSIAFAQAKVSTVSTLKGGVAASASYAATGKAVMPSDTSGKIKPGTQASLLGGVMPGGSVVSAAAAKEGENPLYQNTGNAQENPLHKSEAKVPGTGQPIGGIVVKGGQNIIR